MAGQFRPGFNDPKGILIKDLLMAGIICAGPNVPANGTTGYESGAIFFKEGGALGASLYINQGSSTSCLFVALPDLTSLAGGTNIYTLTTATAASVIASKPNNSLFLLGAAAGFTVTMPAATGSGNKYNFATSVTVTSSSNVIDFKAGGATCRGVAITVQNPAGGTTPFSQAYGTASNTNEITMNGTTTGGVIGDYISVRDIATNVFQVTDCNLNSTGTPTSPFGNH